MAPSTAYQTRLCRRMWLGAAQTLLGLGLLGTFFWLPSEQYNQSRFAWQMFLGLSVCLTGLGLGRLVRSRRLLRSPAFYQERSWIEEQDERGQLVERMAWAAMGRILTAVLFAAMLAVLALGQLAVFWNIYIIYMGMLLGVKLLRWWYGRRL